MAKLSKVETRNHNRALEILKQDVLSEDDKEFIFRNYHEAAYHVNGMAGAFFTPLDLAFDTSLELGFDYSRGNPRVIDFCAGVGVLSYAIAKRYPNAKIVCVEINPAYVEVGRKLVPEAEWICADVTDRETMSALGRFHSAISNPPFGRVASFKSKQSAFYSGGEAEFKVIDIASEVAEFGVFIIPQQSAGFAYSGVQCYERNPSDKYNKFARDTGIELDVGLGIDTSVEAYQEWKGVSPRVEIASADFSERSIEAQTQAPQTDLFAMEA